MTAKQALALKPGDTVRRKGDPTEFRVDKVCPHRGSKGECHIFTVDPPGYHTLGGPYLPRDLEHCTD